MIINCPDCQPPSLLKKSKGSEDESPLFKISLAQWSLHRHLFGNAIEKLRWSKLVEELKKDSLATMIGKITNLDFPVIARKKFEIDAVEYVNQFFLDKAKDKKYLKELKNRSDSMGVKNLLIMCDHEGNLGSKSEKERKKAVENHYKWIDAARLLGCHSIRVNAQGDGSAEDQKKQMVESLSKLVEYSGERGINLIVENHGGLSSNATWLSEVVKEVNHPCIGTLPDFGNFPEEIDMYESIEKLMPFAKGVSAKSYNFDKNGNETNIDYMRMVRIVVAAGYRGHLGIEYEGENLVEYEGIRKTKDLLERIRNKLEKS